MRLLWSPRMPGSGNPSTHCFGKRYWIGMGKRWTCRKSDNNLVNGHLSLVNGPITNDQRLLWLVAFDLILRYDYPAAHVNLRPPEALAHEPASRPLERMIRPVSVPQVTLGLIVLQILVFLMAQ